MRCRSSDRPVVFVTDVWRARVIISRAVFNRRYRTKSHWNLPGDTLLSSVLFSDLCGAPELCFGNDVWKSIKRNRDGLCVCIYINRERENQVQLVTLLAGRRFSTTAEAIGLHAVW